jgi:cytochrome c oxidase subunit II
MSLLEALASRRAQRIVAIASLAVIALLVFAGCSAFDGPQNTFAVHGETGEWHRRLFIMVIPPALIIMLFVWLGVVYIMWRFRQRSPDDPLPVQVHGNPRLEITWTIAPAILMIIVAVPTLIGIIELGRAPAADALQLEVTGQRFAWEVEYPEYTNADGRPVRVVNEFYIPVDRELAVHLKSIDVIHSFWIPKLGGKLDNIPGRTNTMWMRAKTTGEFRGQCAEFCGDGHSRMIMTAHVVTEEEFEQWIADQLGDDAPPPDENGEDDENGDDGADENGDGNGADES